MSNQIENGAYWMRCAKIGETGWNLAWVTDGYTRNGPQAVYLQGSDNPYSLHELRDADWRAIAEPTA